MEAISIQTGLTRNSEINEEAVKEQKQMIYVNIMIVYHIIKEIDAYVSMRGVSSIFT